MRPSIIFIGVVCAMGVQTAPVTSRISKALRYGGLENDEVLIDSNAIPPEISVHLNRFFSKLTPNDLRMLLRTSRWGDEVPYEFQPDPDVETRTRGYQELYNDFLESRSKRF